MKIATYIASVALIGATLPLAGCANPVQRHLQGRWFGETVENVDTDQIAKTTAWARGTTLEFAGRSVTITVPEQNPRSAHYDIVSAQGEEATIALHRADGSTDEAVFSLDSDDVIRWHVNDRHALVLRREH